MSRSSAFLVLLIGSLASATLATAQDVRRPSEAEHPYASLAPRVETYLRFVSDFSFVGGPAFQVKVYDWVIGPRQEITNFPVEGFATIEVKAGEVETILDGVATTRREGEHWIVPERTNLVIRVKSDTGRGDNVVSLHGVIVIRK
jgi:hypothetical protein